MIASMSVGLPTLKVSADFRILLAVRELGIRALLVTMLVADPASGEMIWLASHAPDQTSAAGNGPSAATGSFSADGRFLVFSSQATDLIDGGADSNGGNDVFLWDRISETITLVSHVPGAPLTAGNGPSTAITRNAISADGRFVVFMSTAMNLIAGGNDSNGAQDVFVWDRLSGSTTLASHAAAGSSVAANGASVPYGISSDGNVVTFTSEATNLVSGVVDANGLRDVFIWTRLDNESQLVSHSGSSPTTTANGRSYSPSSSGNGRLVAFLSGATDLVAAGTDTNGGSDVFLWNCESDFVTLVSHAAGTPGVTGNDVSGFFLGQPAISSSGSHVVFDSYATNLVAGLLDENSVPDVFAWERSSDSMQLVSHRAGEPLRTANGVSYPDPDAISRWGELIAFDSLATDLVLGGSDTNGSWDGFVWDASSNSSVLVTHTSGSSTTSGNAASGIYQLDPGGATALVGSTATDLVAGGSDTNQGFDVFRWDRASGELLLISHSAASATTTGNASSWGASISPDGRLTHFRSEATDLVPGAFQGMTQAFVWCEVGCEPIHFGFFETGDLSDWSVVVP